MTPKVLVDVHEFKVTDGERRIRVEPNAVDSTQEELTWKLSTWPHKQPVDGLVS